jgi:hypothetical protein
VIPDLGTAEVAERSIFFLKGDEFGRFVDDACVRVYDPVIGPPSLPSGRWLRLLLVGYFEDINSERGNHSVRCDASSDPTAGC